VYGGGWGGGGGGRLAVHCALRCVNCAHRCGHSKVAQSRTRLADSRRRAPRATSPPSQTRRNRPARSSKRPCLQRSSRTCGERWSGQRLLQYSIPLKQRRNRQDRPAVDEDRAQAEERAQVLGGRGGGGREARVYIGAPRGNVAVLSHADPSNAHTCSARTSMSRYVPP
jgi:hypothetical protein